MPVSDHPTTLMLVAKIGMKEIPLTHTSGIHVF